MLITVPSPYEPAMLRPQTPPPAILPKPGKDNLRLQRLLKKVAKQAPSATQQVKSFQASLSPVSEASPDLERSERASPLKTPGTLPQITIQLPPRFCIRPVIHHVASPFPKAKPFAFKVTEQRRISEHLKLTVSPAASPVHRQGIRESQWQPRGTTPPERHSQLRSPQPHCVFVFPDTAVSASPVVEAPVEVTQVTEVQACVHSVQAPRAKTPLSDQSSTALSSEGRQSLAAHTGKPSGQASVALGADEAGASIPNSKAPVLPPLTAGLPYTTPRPATPREPDGVSQVTATHTNIHSVCVPRVKTPLSGQAPTALSNEGRMSSATHLEVSYLERPLGQTPVTHTANQAATATPKSKASKLPTTTAELSHPSGPTQPVGVAVSSPRTPDPQFSSPETPGNDTARSRTEWIPEPHSKSLRPLTPRAAQKQETTVPTDNTRAFSTERKEESVIPRQLTATIPRASPVPKAEPPPPSVEKVRPLKATLSGWSRLKKHLIVEPEEPQFPETEPAKPEPEEAGNKVESSQGKASQDSKLIKSRAIKMWDAVLYQMTTLKKRRQQEEKGIRKEEGISRWYRLPLLHRPRFDARKLKELASKPMMKITTMLESSLLQCKTTEDSKNFNRTAPGWLLK
nr:proline-rich protein 33-like isoform X2 [Pelodiscus sinensis]|eukprot:XP_014434910.1 proline-rich protein 33-like isoform X2 [Pelodiscus sinensis]